MTLFGYKMLVALIIVGGLQLVNALTADAAPPDVVGVIHLKSFLDVFSKENPIIMMFCTTSNKNSTIITHNILEHEDGIRFTGPAVNKTAEYNAGVWPWGVACRQLGNHNNYQVTIPIRYKNDSRTPTKLSYTLDPDQDLIVNVRKTVNRINQRWRKVDGSYQYTNISNGQLIIPHQQLKGSGIYTIGYSGSQFSLLIRECTRGRYGPDCTKLCPDCMNSGMCHPQTGYCVCPPGVMGSLCETRCPFNMLGKDCTVRVPYTAGVAVCVSHPVGCTCLPGYQGKWCEEECNHGHFGADCQGDCECSEDDCDKATGFCNQGNINEVGPSGFTTTGGW